MRELTRGVFVRGAVLSGAMAMLGFLSSQALAQSTNPDDTAGYVVVPKVLVRNANPDPKFRDPNLPSTDTLIQLTNTSERLISVECHYVNANGRCGNVLDPTAAPCWTARDCDVPVECVEGQCGGPGGAACEEVCPPLTQACVPNWAVGPDIKLQVTPLQPIGWSVSTGEVSGSADLPCFLPGGRACGPGQNTGKIKPVGSDPFRGELKCVQLTVDNDGSEDDLKLPEGVPAVLNDLKVEATIIHGGGPIPNLDASAYNGVGFQAQRRPLDGNGDPEKGLLCLGDGPPPGETEQCAVEYTPCSNLLIVEHFFDGALIPLKGGKNTAVATSLTLVPCSEDLVTGSPPLVRVQALVFNEFEQRFSTNLGVECYRDTLLSDIDTLADVSSDDRYSIFSVAVQGTATGQTRLKGVLSPGLENGVGLLGVTQEFYRMECKSGLCGGDGMACMGNADCPVVASAAYNVQTASGMTPLMDAVKIPPKAN